MHKRQLALYDPANFPNERLKAGKATSANAKPTDALFTKPDYTYIDQCMKTALLDVAPEDGPSCAGYFGATSMLESVDETVRGQPNYGANSAWSYKDKGGFDFGNNVARFVDHNNHALRLCAADGTCSPFATEGRVEASHDDGNGPRWGSLTQCPGSAFGQNEANTICKQLGFVGAFYNDGANIVLDGWGVVGPASGVTWDNAYSFNRKGYGKELAPAAYGSQIWLDDFTCPATAEHIDSCTLSRGWGSHDVACEQEHAVAVSCIPRNNAIRLCEGGDADNGGSKCAHSATKGRVEVFRHNTGVPANNGAYGTVCNNGFAQDAANAVCRQLGYSTALGFTPPGSAVTLGWAQRSAGAKWFYDTSAQNQPMWMSDLTCADTDKRLDECKMYDGTNADNRAASFDVWLDVRASPVVGGHGDNCASDD